MDREAGSTCDNWFTAETQRTQRNTTVRTANLLAALNETRDILGLKMQSRSESELREQLEAEGFSHTFVWQDGPGAFYPDHTHAGLTAHIILDGEMTLRMNGASRTYRAGERCDVPAGATHSAKMGPHGCRYLVGEN